MTSNSTPIINTVEGPVQGDVQSEILVFKGIPYARPPMDALRWKEPQPVEPWNETLKTDTFSKACLQPTYPSMDGAGNVGLQSEDCLYLNVWTSGVDRDALKPVMVWIHGGAFKIGVGSDEIYSGVRLAREGAVVVTLNYRVGLLGFFAHPGLEKERPLGPVNFGLLDQIAALEWVQRNIAAFGGDPGNVTIFGQSAGAESVLALFASPLSRDRNPPLFHKGIAQSPYALPEQSREKASELGVKVARWLFGLDGEHATAEELRAVPPEKFAEKAMPTPEDPGGQVPFLGPAPVRGDVVLPKGLRATFEAGEQTRRPLIIGSNSDEASVLKAFDMDPAVVMQMIIEAGGEEAENALKTLKGLYRSDPEVTDEDLKDPDRFAGLVLRDMLFTANARWFADKHSKVADTRWYYFSYVPEGDRESQPHGVSHGGEMLFPFGNIKDRFTAADRAMSEKVSNYWFSFAKDGTPAGQPAWPKHETGLFVRDKTLKLGETIEVAYDFRKVRLDALIAQYPKLEEALEGGGGSGGGSR
ncbi:carboxylesterase/lipase family protein [Sorangium sp. So ce233]|uniref:carboxylesterase/lipase family protein n=1 Tax=Sorangium sp. So ce233 TaxID=3133290 RepID=UPI003F5F84D5